MKHINDSTDMQSWGKGIINWCVQRVLFFLKSASLMRWTLRVTPLVTTMFSSFIFILSFSWQGSTQVSPLGLDDKKNHGEWWSEFLCDGSLQHKAKDQTQTSSPSVHFGKYRSRSDSLFWEHVSYSLSSVSTQKEVKPHCCRWISASPRDGTSWPWQRCVCGKWTTWGLNSHTHKMLWWFIHHIPIKLFH